MPTLSGSRAARDPVLGVPFGDAIKPLTAGFHAPTPYSKSSMKNVPATNVPVPLRPTGNVLTLVATARFAERGPAAVGVKLTSQVQLAPGATPPPWKQLVDPAE